MSALRTRKRRQSAQMKLRSAAQSVMEGLEARRLMIVNEQGFLTSFSANFEGTDQPQNATWNGGDVFDYPAASTADGKFMRFDDSGSLTISGIYKHVGVEVFLRLHLLGDVSPSGGCSATGSGVGPSVRITVDGKQDDTSWTDTPYDSDWLNYSIAGDEMEDDGNAGCVSNSEVEQNRSYIVSVTNHTHDATNLTITFAETTGSGTTRFGIDEVNVFLVKALLPGRRNNDPNENKDNRNDKEEPGPDRPPGPGGGGGTSGAICSPMVRDPLFGEYNDNASLGPGNRTANGYFTEEGRLHQIDDGDGNSSTNIYAAYGRCGDGPYIFDSPSATTFNVRHNENIKLSKDGDYFVLTDSKGNRTRYLGFGGGVPSAGAFESYTDWRGNKLLEVVDDSYLGGGAIGRTRHHLRDGQYEDFVYSYPGGSLQLLTIERGESEFKEVYYEYGTGSTVQFATITTNGTATGKYFYRLRATDDLGGHAGSVQYVFGPQAYERLKAAFPSSDLTTISVGSIAPYADAYYEYTKIETDAEEKYVPIVRKVIRAGEGPETRVLSRSPFTDDVNKWSRKTVATLPDENIQITFVNYRGQVMLDSLMKPASTTTTLTSIEWYSATSALVTANGHGYSVGDRVLITGADPEVYNGLFTITHADTNTFRYTVAADPVVNATGASLKAVEAEKVWSTFYKYDSSGNQVMKAYPSAVKTFDESKADLLNLVSGNYEHLWDNQGKIEVTDYYSSTTATGTTLATAGGVQGYIWREKVQRGDMDSSPIVLSEITYYKRTNPTSGLTTFLKASYTEYAASGAAEPRTTRYEYGFDGTTNQVVWRKTIAPPVLASHNGRAVDSADTGRADTTFEYYDQWGRAVWIRDAAGSLTYREYDPITGAITKQITDVDLSELSSSIPRPSLTGIATQSSDLYQHTGFAGSAVDGDTDGDSSQDSVTHTAEDSEAWWKVDLGAVYSIDDIEVYNRTDCCGSRLSNFYVFVSDNPFTSNSVSGTLAQSGVSAYYFSGTAGADESFSIDRTGRYVKVQLTGTNFLSLAEVKILAPVVSALHLETTRDVDDQGRVTKETDANGNVTYTRYKDTATLRETRVYRGWYLDGSTYKTTGPIEVTRELRNLGYSESFTMAGTPTVNGSGEPTGAEAIDNLIGFSRTVLSENGETAESQRYFDLAGMIRTSSPGNPQVESFSPGSVQIGQVYTLLVQHGTTVVSVSHIATTTSGSDVVSALKALWNVSGNPLYNTIVADNQSAGTLTLAISSGTFYATAGVGYRTLYDYDAMGRQNRELRPTGTIYRSMYDARGNLVSSWVGTNDTGATDLDPDGSGGGNNMIKVSESAYDGGSTVIGDNNVTSMTLYPGGGASARVSNMYYDWRGRVIGSAPSGGPLTYVALNNLGEVEESLLYYATSLTRIQEEGGTDSDGVPNDPSGSIRRAKTVTEYDDQGRAFRTTTYSVDASTGGVSSTGLKSETWYDVRGQLLKSTQPGGPTTKYAYDGVGRTTKVFTTDGNDSNAVTLTRSGTIATATLAGHHYKVGDVVIISGASQSQYNGTFAITAVDTNTFTYTMASDPGASSSGTVTSWRDATTRFGDIVLSQQEMTYDLNGNTISLIDRQRFHNATATGDLQDKDNNPKARVSYSAFYFDKVDRIVAEVNVGTNGGSAYTRPGSVPSRTSDVLVTSYEYLDGDNAIITTDPGSTATKTFYDGAGRVSKVIEDFSGDGLPDGSANRNTDYIYDGNDNVILMRAVFEDCNYEITRYTYNATTGTGSAINSKDILTKVEYPDLADRSTTSTTLLQSEAETFTYNGAGEMLTKSDRNGTLHTYTYDDAGRMTRDAVTTVGSGVNGTVRRIDYSFDELSRPSEIFTYDSTSGGNGLSAIRYEYNGLGQLIKEWQNTTAGAINGSETPNIQYIYSEMAGGANHSRLTKMVYPDGRTLYYGYSSGIDDTISRLSFLADDNGLGASGTHIEEYTYLGADTIVKRAHPQSRVDLTYLDSVTGGASNDFYTGLDRFGRVVDQRWAEGSTDIDRYQYGYDENSNRTYRDDRVNSGQDQVFTYDDLDRLIGYDKGVADNTTHAIASPTYQKDWALDALGNWDEVSVNGTAAEDRTHNHQNQITAIGTDDLFYDDNGNLSVDESSDQGYVYDAWNRLVEVIDTTPDPDESLIVYRYDGVGRRIVETPDGGTAKHFYHSSQWQVLEEREGATPQNSSASTQYVWSPIYVDALLVRDTQATDGTLDTSFGENGIVFTDVTSSVTDTSRGIAIQTDGKIIVVGSSASDFAVARYNTDGTLDTSFNSGGSTPGTIKTNVGGSDEAFGVVIDANGKIVVVGKSNNSMAIVRYNSDGTLDTTFDGGDGIITSSLGASARGVALDSSGRIVVAGQTSGADAVVARFHASGGSTGTADTSFGTSGAATVNFGSADIANAIALDANGKIVIAGTTGTGGSMDFAIARLHANGSLDTNSDSDSSVYFDTDGMVTTDFGSGWDDAYGLAIDSNGKIIAVGDTKPGSYYDFAIARYDSGTGALDTSFSSDGKQTVDFTSMVGSDSDDRARAVLVQHGGSGNGNRIVIAGEVGPIDFGLARITASGSLDGTFGTSGRVMTDGGDGGGSTSTALALAQQGDGKIVVTGQGSVSGQSSFALARYHGSTHPEERLYALQDANFNVTSITDSGGEVLERYTEDPYGNVTVLDPNGSADADGLSDYGQVYLHQGGRFSTVTGLMHFRYREYSSALGRWMQQDPMGYVDGMSSYEYLKSSVLSYFDPDGTSAKARPPASERPRFMPAGYGVGLSDWFDIAFIQWTVSVPAGIAGYSFQWGAYDAESGRSLTGLPAIQRRRQLPWERLGHTRIYFNLERSTDFWLANFALGATGRKAEDYPSTRAFYDENDGQTTYGFQSAQLIVWEAACGDEVGQTLEQAGGRADTLNNSNRNYYFLGLPILNLFGDGTEPPVDHENRKVLFRAAIDVTWYKGNYYVHSWKKDYVNDTESNGHLTGTFQPSRPRP